MKRFPINTDELRTFERTLEVARENNWSMERAFAELRVSMYIDLDLESAHKTMALDELNEIKELPEVEMSFNNISNSTITFT